MRLPRRVPWSSLTELDQVCSWIYTDESDLEAKLLAVQRVSVCNFICMKILIQDLVVCVESNHHPATRSRIYALTAYSDCARFVTCRFLIIPVDEAGICCRTHQTCKWPGRSAAAWSVCSPHRKHRRPARSSPLVGRVATCGYARRYAKS